MSCFKCGSDWVTATGKNCASCPHCCKVARCNARKQGRWNQSSHPRQCVECHKTFTPDIAKQNAEVCSPACKKERRRKWRRKHMLQYRKGVRKCVQVHGQAMPPCLNCGKPVKERRHDHCGRKCFNESRRKGIVAWDKTGQQLGDLRKRKAQGLRMPSEVMHAEIQAAMQKQFEQADLLWRKVSAWQSCKNCGGPLKEHARDHTEFCSIACAAKYEHVETCRVCGVQHNRVGVQGRKGSMCKRCRRKAHNKQRTHTKGIAERAKKYGVLRVKYCRNEIFVRDQWKCQLCNCCLRRKWTFNRKTLVPHHRNATIDHIVPMSKGGDDAEWNVQACCLACNGKKGARTKGQSRLKFL